METFWLIIQSPLAIWILITRDYLNYCRYVLNRKERFMVGVLLSILAFFVWVFLLLVIPFITTFWIIKLRHL